MIFLLDQMEMAKSTTKNTVILHTNAYFMRGRRRTLKKVQRTFLNWPVHGSDSNDTLASDDSFDLTKKLTSSYNIAISTEPNL